VVSMRKMSYGQVVSLLQFCPGLKRFRINSVTMFLCVELTDSYCSVKAKDQSLVILV